MARKIPAGADIVLQMHYTTIGQPVTDQTQIGVVLAKEPPTKLRAGGGGQIPNASFAIPPGDPNYEVVAKQTINRDTYLSTHVSAHARARQGRVVRDRLSRRQAKRSCSTCRSTTSTGRLSYRLAEPKFMPKGSTLLVNAHYDNSKNNPFNPDPGARCAGAIRRGKRC